MIDPNFARPGRFLPHLALDAALPLYPILHVPPDDGSFAMHGFVKQVMEYAKLHWDHNVLWSAAQEYARTTLSAADAALWLGWIYNGYSGIHQADPDRKDWIAVLHQFQFNPATWENSGMTAPEVEAAHAFLDLFYTEINEPAFMEAVAECQARPLTPWDKRLHQAYDFVYFDRAGGSDPFLVLKIMNIGEALRRALRATDLASPLFPNAALQRMGDRVLAGWNMARLMGLPSLSTLL
ncbi:MAG: hypothetical protein RLZZ437_2329 [Pseudomonadota bacterium]|jgi:hypothetical protein